MIIRLKKWGISIFLATSVWTGQLCRGQSKTEASVVVNLRGYGWEPPDSHEVDWPSIAVDHAGRVIVGFAVRARNGLVTRGQPSLDFHIVRFSHDGKEDLSLSVPTNARGRNSIYLSDTDQIIARANDSIQLLQAGAGGSKEQVWKILAPCTLRCLVEQSYSRHTLLLYTAEADPMTLIRLSQQSAVQRCGKAPQLIESAEDKIQNYPTSITDEFAYSLGGREAYRWPLCDYEHREEMPLLVNGRWTVLNDRVFVGNTYNTRKNQWGLEVILSDGQVKFRPDIVKHESAHSLWAPIRGSERGDRVAVDMSTVRGGSRALDLSGHLTARRVAVFDIEAGKEIASIPVKTKHHYRLEFDLSPDGHRLAILEDDMVKVFNVEGASASQR
jgi:hypothetical protein